MMLSSSRFSPRPPDQFIDFPPFDEYLLFRFWVQTSGERRRVGGSGCLSIRVHPRVTQFCTQKRKSPNIYSGIDVKPFVTKD